MNNQTRPQTGAEQVIWDLNDLYAAVDDPALDIDEGLRRETSGVSTPLSSFFTVRRTALWFSSR